MSTLISLASFANRSGYFLEPVKRLGFSTPGDIDRFVFGAYGKAVRELRPADRLNGAFFILEPGIDPNVLPTPSALCASISQIRTNTNKKVFALHLDVQGGPREIHAFTPEERNLGGNGWSQQPAQWFSRKERKCVMWAKGVSAVIYLDGDIYLESPDVVEELPSGCPVSFQSLSWDDGRIVFDFADGDLNDTGETGIWLTPDKRVLRPKPEVIIQRRFGKFLCYRLAGYAGHDEEPHVENEGRADISLHLIDGRALIVEIKWMGCSLVASRLGSTDDQIKKAVNDNTRNWFTKFDEKIIASGVRQLVRYYKTGKYGRAYLTVFDCGSTAAAHQSDSVPISESDLDGHDTASFRVLRASVDPRTASQRAKSSSKSVR